MMIDRILTVGGFTLLSRVTGFLRDIMLAAILGAGPVADALRGAAAAQSFPRDLRGGRLQRRLCARLCRIREANGAAPSQLFADPITLLLAGGAAHRALAQRGDAGQRPALPRITFRYLLISLVTLMAAS